MSAGSAFEEPVGELLQALGELWPVGYLGPSISVVVELPVAFRLSQDGAGDVKLPTKAALPPEGDLVGRGHGQSPISSGVSAAMWLSGLHAAILCVRRGCCPSWYIISHQVAPWSTIP